MVTKCIGFLKMQILYKKMLGAKISYIKECRQGKYEELRVLLIVKRITIYNCNTRATSFTAWEVEQESVNVLSSVSLINILFTSNISFISYILLFIILHNVLFFRV